MKQTPRTIPSAFVKLDDSVTAADRFIDVRTQQILRANHNALLSGAHARVVLNHFFRSTQADEPEAKTIVQGEDSAFGDIGHAMCLLNTRVRISQYIKQLGVRIRCNVTRALQVNFYPVLSRPNVPRDLSNVTALTTSSTTLTNVTGTITVPPMLQQRDGGVECDFALYADCDTYGATTEAPPPAINAVVTNKLSNTGVVRVTTASLSGNAQVGDVMYFPSNTAVEPRRIYFAPSVVGETWFYTHPLNPWESSEQAPAAADTFQAVQSAIPQVAWVQLLELPRTGTFDTLLEKI